MPTEPDRKVTTFVPAHIAERITAVQDALSEVLSQRADGMTIGFASVVGSKVRACLNILSDDAQVTEQTFTLAIDRD